MEHQRIDEGITRKTAKPRRRAPYRTRESKRDQLMLSRVPADLDPETVLDLYACAPTSAAVSRRLNIRRGALVAWLKQQRPVEWKAIQIVRAEIRKEDGNLELDEGVTAIDLHRARERVKSAQWDLERLDAGNYAAKQEHLVTVQPVLNVTIVAHSPQLTDVQTQQSGEDARIIPGESAAVTDTR